MNLYQNCFINIDDTDISFLEEAARDKSISGKGPSVERYEMALQQFFDSPYAICCSNGTAGIHMIMMLENIREGDEVLIPPTAPIMSVLPVIASGATPVFIDTCSKGFHLSLEDIDRKRSPRTKLLINVPMWGYANNIIEVSEYCNLHGIKVLEDNSHCHGTLLEGRLMGTTGDYAVFSTHERKLVTTGEGGFLLVKDRNDYEKLLEIRSFGEVAKTGEQFRNIKGAYGYYFGMNFKLSAINAALGISQLAKLKHKISKRTDNTKHLVGGIHALDMNIRELAARPGSVSNYYSVVFLASPEMKRKIELRLLGNNIISDPLRYRYCPLYEMPLFEKYARPCPQAEVLIRSVFTLPVHEGLSEKDMDHFIAIIQSLKHD